MFLLGDFELTSAARRLFPSRRRRDVRRRARSRCGRSARRPTSATGSRWPCVRCSCAASGCLLIDAGVGDKMDAKSVRHLRHRSHAEPDARRSPTLGLSTDDIDIVLASHLHFDHAGGFTARDDAGAVRPAFPHARYVVRRGRVGGRDASARAEPRELPAGELRAARSRRRARPRGRGRRDHAGRDASGGPAATHAPLRW